MTRKTAVQCASLVFVSAVTASFGMTSFVTADAINHTGPHSQNKIKPTIKNKCDIYTKNDVDIWNENKQKAESGDVSIKDDDKRDDHDKWEHESPKEDARPTSAELTDQTEEQTTVATQPAATDADRMSSEDSEDNATEQPSIMSGDHESEQKKVGDIKTGDAINSNESKFKVNIETDNECFPKKAPHAHKPSQHAKPSVKPKVTPPKAVAPTASAGAGQGAGFGAGVAPSVSQAPQPVAQPSRPVQHQAPKPAAPRPPEQVEHVSNNVNITTHNSVSISNTNHQSAQSGDATVSNNGHVGNVSTGDAVNDNRTHASVNIETSNN